MEGGQRLQATAAGSSSTKPDPLQQTPQISDYTPEQSVHTPALHFRPRKFSSPFVTFPSLNLDDDIGSTGGARRSLVDSGFGSALADQGLDRNKLCPKYHIEGLCELGPKCPLIHEKKSTPFDPNAPEFHPSHLHKANDSCSFALNKASNSANDVSRVWNGASNSANDVRSVWNKASNSANNICNVWNGASNSANDVCSVWNGASNSAVGTSNVWNGTSHSSIGIGDHWNGGVNSSDDISASLHGISDFENGSEEMWSGLSQNLRMDQRLPRRDERLARDLTTLALQGIRSERSPERERDFPSGSPGSCIHPQQQDQIFCKDQNKPDEGRTLNPLKSKTEPCLTFFTIGSCPYGVRCFFYHKVEEKSRMKTKLKTRLCKSWTATGWCEYGQRCDFAHGCQELTIKFKTRMCNVFLTTGRCPYGAQCTFAHTDDERRRDISSVYKFKTEICQLWLRGDCSYGPGCHFAHGVLDLKTGVDVPP